MNERQHRAFDGAAVLEGRHRTSGVRGGEFARRERGQQAYAERLLADIDAEARPADLSVAAGAYRRALDLAESLHMRPLVAQCLLGLARLHRQAGERDQARKGLADAIARFSTMGMTLWVERAQADLDA